MKFRNITFIFSLLILFGCDKLAGTSVTETLEITNTYIELRVQDAIDVVISNSVEEARITGGENVISYVAIEEANGMLDIRRKDGKYFLNSTVKVELPYNPNLGKMAISDASDIDCEVNAEEFVISLTDASDAKLQGHIGKLKINLDDASSIKKNVVNKRYALSCDECEVSMSGASDAYLHCDGNIKIIKLEGASDLHYTGNATITFAGGIPSSSSDIKNDKL